MPTALITGSAGLVGSAAVANFAAKGWRVLGIDNDQRERFFGPSGSTRSTRETLRARFPSYEHYDIDIRDEVAIGDIFRTQGRHLDLILHAAAQPSHDWAATAPLVDFQINATATLFLLESTRLHCPEAVFIFVSTNKVYGDTPNRLPLIEQPTRWEVAPEHEYAAHGISESMSIDQNLHSIFGCSKVAADVLVQEYGRYFGMRTGTFRCGCITGGNQAAVELHGFLAHVMRCAVHRTPYVIHGYAGKQVRDNIHAADLVAAFEEFYRDPKPGEVYNMGGGRHSNCSVLEAIQLCEEVSGHRLSVSYDERARKGDHIWWISDVGKFRRHYPKWSYGYDLRSILSDLHSGARLARASS